MTDSAPARRQLPKPNLGRVALLATAIALLLLWPTAREHARAMSLLARMSQQHSLLARAGRGSFDVRAISFHGGSGPIHAKLYVPAGLVDPPAMVVVHGLHHLGMEEPRLVNFAKSLAETGVEVLTPQVDAIADYRVLPESISVIGESATELQRINGGKEVGVLGLSFAGGLSLMAAADSRYGEAISFVAAIGAQEDVQRVEHYLVEGKTTWPDGRALTTPPHEYGWLILIYSHPENFFPSQDVSLARDSLRLLLHENVEQAKQLARSLSPAGRDLMNSIFDHQRDAFRQRLEADLDSHSPEAIAVSPHEHLQALKAKVLLVHGEGDDVIPPSETEWLAQDLPRGVLQEALISRAISHVNLEAQPGWRDQWEIVHWIALMLGDADHEHPPRPK